MANNRKAICIKKAGPAANEEAWTDFHSQKLWDLYFQDKLIDKKTTAGDILGSMNEKMRPLKSFSNKTLANHITRLRKRINKYEKQNIPGRYFNLFPITDIYFYYNNQMTRNVIKERFQP